MVMFFPFPSSLLKQYTMISRCYWAKRSKQRKRAACDSSRATKLYVQQVSKVLNQKLNMQGCQTLTQGLPIRGFNLIYEKNARFLCKIIWFLFRSIAVGLPLRMKNNIIHVASAARFAGPCSFDEIFHYIFAHLELYFVDKGTDFMCNSRANSFFRYS